MDIDEHVANNKEPLRRSQRIKNRYNSSNGIKLSGNKYYLFTHNFQKNAKNTNNSNNNNDTSSNLPLYPCISRSNRKLKMVHHSPNVFIIDNFLTSNEINHLMNIVENNNNKFEVSYTQSTGTDQIYSQERTSTFIFLQKYMDKISRTIEGRAADIVSIAIENVEPLQLVKYTNGQEFTLHHDSGTLINETLKQASSSSLWSLASSTSNKSNLSNKSCEIITGNIIPNIPPQQFKSSEEYAIYYQMLQKQYEEQQKKFKQDQYIKYCQQKQTQTQNNNDEKNDGNDNDSMSSDEENLTKEEISEKYDTFNVELVAPVRLFSFFVYLTTLPPDCGGETYFPKLGLKVRPQTGKAVLWCNVDANNTLKADPMLIHRAMPVKGNHLKVGMNVWIDATKVDY